MTGGEKAAVGISIGVVVIGIIAFLCYHFRPQLKTATPILPVKPVEPNTPDKPKQLPVKPADPVLPVVVPVIVIPKPPQAPAVPVPSPVPCPGQYYRVQTGDSPAKVANRAGLPSGSWRKMRDHVLNSWMEKRFSWGEAFPYTDDQDSLPFFKWFPEPGWNVQPIAEETTPGCVFPLVYVPTHAEVNS